MLTGFYIAYIYCISTYFASALPWLYLEIMYVETKVLGGAKSQCAKHTQHVWHANSNGYGSMPPDRF